jgi:two-component system cell cycle response regulator
LRQDDPLLAGQLPEPDQRVRKLLDSGRFADADTAFDELTQTAPNHVADAENRATTLVHRALLAWRLGRIPLALELAAEGWTDLDTDGPVGTSAAHTISIIGYLLETVGHRESALELMSMSVHVARDSEDPVTLAHCLMREANALLFRAIERRSGSVQERFAKACELYDEALSLTSPGEVHRAVLAGGARALAGIGSIAEAERRAQAALRLSTEANDLPSGSITNWALAGIRREQGNLVEARTLASRALDAAEKIRDTMLLMRFSQDLSAICADLGDYVGESAALRRTVRAGRTAVETLQEGLGQALEQRRVAVQAQRLAVAAQEAAIRDPLTGLTNRRGLERHAPALLEQTAARGHVPWLVLVDMDWFKDVNDDAGHTAGDAALQEIASLLRRECRAGDLICRWAGDEFVVLLVDITGDSRAAGPAVAERIRAAVHAHDWRLVLGHIKQPPTVSIGVAAGPARLEHLFAAADIALYRAKRAGRNRVEVDGSGSPQSPSAGP